MDKKQALEREAALQARIKDGQHDKPNYASMADHRHPDGRLKVPNPPTGGVFSHEKDGSLTERDPHDFNKVLVRYTLKDGAWKAPDPAPAASVEKLAPAINVAAPTPTPQPPAAV